MVVESPEGVSDDEVEVLKGGTGGLSVVVPEGLLLVSVDESDAKLLEELMDGVDVISVTGREEVEITVEELVLALSRELVGSADELDSVLSEGVMD